MTLEDKHALDHLHCLFSSSDGLQAFGECQAKQLLSQEYKKQTTKLLSFFYFLIIVHLLSKQNSIKCRLKLVKIIQQHQPLSNQK